MVPSIVLDETHNCLIRPETLLREELCSFSVHISLNLCASCASSRFQVGSVQRRRVPMRPLLLYRSSSQPSSLISLTLKGHAVLLHEKMGTHLPPLCEMLHIRSPNTITKIKFWTSTNLSAKSFRLDIAWSSLSYMVHGQKFCKSCAGTAIILFTERNYYYATILIE